MDSVITQIANSLGAPERACDPMTSEDMLADLYLQTVLRELPAGWYRDEFLCLFSKELDAFAPCVEAWGWLRDVDVPFRVVGKNAYGMLLVAEGDELRSLSVLDPTRMRFWLGGYDGLFPALRDTFLRGRTPLLESALYQHWRARTGARLSPTQMLAVRPARDVSKLLGPDEVEPVDVVEWFRATARAAEKWSKANDETPRYSPKTGDAVDALLVHGKVPDALAAGLRAPAECTHLDLSAQGLQSLPPQIAQLRSLRQLNLENNRLTRLPDEIGALSALTRLDLSNNRLESLPESFGELRDVYWLNLSRNRLESLPESFGNLRSLQFLFLEENRLTALPASMGRLAKLSHLALENNRLRSLPDSMSALGALDTLELQRNRIEQVPDWLADLPKLRHAELRLNRITKKPKRTAKEVLTHTASARPVGLRRVEKKPTAKSLMRIGGLPIGIGPRTWPRHDGKPMLHVFTVDLRALELSIPRAPDARALALFMPSKIVAWDHTRDARLVTLSEKQLARGVAERPADLDDDALLEPATLATTPLDDEDVESDESLAAIGSLAGGKPAWIQSPADPDDPDAVFVLQIEGTLIPDLELTPGAILYVFDCEVTLQR